MRLDITNTAIQDIPVIYGAHIERVAGRIYLVWRAGDDN